MLHIHETGRHPSQRFAVSEQPVPAYRKNAARFRFRSGFRGQFSPKILPESFPIQQRKSAGAKSQTAEPGRY